MSLTIKQLITKLQAIENQDALVIMSSDSEGNSFGPIADVTEGGYHAETKWSGYVVDEMSEKVEGTVPAVVFWPTN